MENCANHTFWFSVDMQLFVMALVICWLYVKNRRLGVSVAIVLMMTDFIVTGYMSHVYKTTHNLGAYPLDVKYDN